VSAVPSAIWKCLQVARLAGIEADIVSKARTAGQQIENKLQASLT
jgi:DNA mismatch repair ATPase MutS